MIDMWRQCVFCVGRYERRNQPYWTWTSPVHWWLTVWLCVVIHVCVCGLGHCTNNATGAATVWHRGTLAVEHYSRQLFSCVTQLTDICDGLILVSKHCKLLSARPFLGTIWYSKQEFENWSLKHDLFGALQCCRKHKPWNLIFIIFLIFFFVWLTN